MITDVINFVIDQAILGGLLDKNTDRQFKVITPRVALRDSQRMGGALARMGDFFNQMHALNVYTSDEIRDMLDIFLAAMGFDVPEKAGPIEEPEIEPTIGPTPADQADAQIRVAKAVPKPSLNGKPKEKATAAA